jgi:nucleotide-binding universal stress UspA family protein
MINSIVVGTDGSSTANKAVSEAIALAKSNKAKLHVVTAFETASLARKQREADENIPRDMQWAFNARDAVDATASDAAALAENEGIEVQAHVRNSSACDALINVAQESDADLIVVGNKGMTGAKRFVASSVPNKVTHNAPCSVLVVQTSA